MSINYRYPGSIPFTKSYESVFFGRDEDIERLSTFISVENVSVLYGKSGLGKSSLLNAGVLPRLEKDHQVLTIPLRFGSWTKENRKHPLDIAAETLMDFTREQTFLDKIERDDISLWQGIRSVQIAHQNHSTILLVLDQFEELFTYPEGGKRE